MNWSCRCMWSRQPMPRSLFRSAPRSLAITPDCLNAQQQDSRHLTAVPVVTSSPSLQEAEAAAELAVDTMHQMDEVSIIHFVSLLPAVAALHQHGSSPLHVCVDVHCTQQLHAAAPIAPCWVHLPVMLTSLGVCRRRPSPASCLIGVSSKHCSLACRLAQQPGACSRSWHTGTPPSGPWRLRWHSCRQVNHSLVKSGTLCQRDGSLPPSHSCIQQLPIARGSAWHTWCDGLFSGAPPRQAVTLSCGQRLSI